MFGAKRIGLDPNSFAGILALAIYASAIVLNFVVFILVVAKKIKTRREYWSSIFSTSLGLTYLVIWALYCVFPQPWYNFSALTIWLIAISNVTASKVISVLLI